MASILVAEDDRAVGAFVQRALTHYGHVVTLVADGAAALEVLGNSRFDLLLTDIAMPVMDGIALALAVGADYPDLPILMMTGYAAEKQRAHNLDVLIHDVLPKPFTLQAIVEAVDRALNARPGD